MADRPRESTQSPQWPRSVSWQALALWLWRAGVRPEWHKRAACRDGDPKWWDGGPHYGEWARAICQRCPVRQECLRDVVAWETRFATRASATMGVAGAMTATERRELYRAFSSVVGRSRARNRS